MSYKRELNPKMVAFFDKALANNGLAQEAIQRKNPRALMVAAATVCVGIREEGGNNTGPMVKLLQDTIEGPDRWAWCMSFVQTCIAYAELKTGIKSPIVGGEHCMSVWNGTPKIERVKVAPLSGAVAIWQKGTSQSGHTGIVLACDNRNFTAVEGNTESGLDTNGKVERDGGGVYHTKRSLAGTGSMKIVGFLKPFPTGALQ